jgi:hypothetical protein
MSSFFTSFPSYLWGLFALAVPIIIHLLSKSKGKPVAVGTLKFFQQVKPVKMTQVKLVEILLLILRLLMLVSAILLVGQLWWLDNKSDSNEDVYLITKNWLTYSSIDEKRALVSKLSENKAYILDDKLSSFNSEQILTWEHSDDFQSIAKPLWSAISMAHLKLSKKAIFHIYTDNLATSFIGEPVKISQPIQWNILSNDEKPLSSNEISPIKVAVIADPNRTHSVLRIQQALILLKEDLMPELSIYMLESQQVMNADKSIEKVMPANLKNTDWLFYLSSDEDSIFLRDALNKRVNVFFDAKGMTKKRINTVISSENEMLLESFLMHQRGDRFPFEQLLEDDDLENQHQVKPVWTSDKGTVALEKHEILSDNSTQVIYQFNSRLETQWSSLAEQPQFVRVILSLLLDKTTPLKQVPHLNARLSLAQIEAFNTLEKPNSKTEIQKYLMLLNYEKQSLTRWLMFLLVVSWCSERLLSERFLRKGIIGHVFFGKEIQSTNTNQVSSSFDKSELT